jgi:hemolysin III
LPNRFCSAAPAERPDVYHLSMVTEHRLGDIIANSVKHGVGAALAVAGAVALVVTAVGGTAWQIASCSVFGCTLVLVYVCSTLYHSLVRTRARHVLRIIDHSAIYLLIAGNLYPIRPRFAARAAGMASVRHCVEPCHPGNCIQEFRGRTFRLGRSVSGMGWLGVFAVRPSLHALTWHGIFWIALGGMFYTAVIVFYAFDGLSYFHAFWHLFVLTGSTCHYFAVLFYVAQPHA